MTMQNCLTLANSSLTSGLCAFLRNIQPALSGFIKGKLKLSLPQVNSLSTSIAIATFYFFDLTYSWMGELNQMINAFSDR